ncbi:uncharacterized protein LOC124144095 [Haliotis rufescens]|uniref:uncharacterized protein LOC124144095 n=1 Tax=Haliotis rufescens TaxID=6454 RepID=UPI00201F362C|nr:uncharacterized protein LOC124144095 [Haliotis rufescens]
MSALTHSLICGLILISTCESVKLFKSMDINTPTHFQRVADFSVSKEARTEVYFFSARFNKNNVFPTMMVVKEETMDPKCNTEAVWKGAIAAGQAGCYDHEDDMVVCFSSLNGSLTLGANTNYTLFALNCQGATERPGMQMHFVLSQEGAKPEDKYDPEPAPNPADHYDITPVIPIAIVLGIIGCIFIVCFCYTSRDCFKQKSSIRKGKKSGSKEETKAFIKEEKEAVP